MVYHREFFIECFGHYIISFGIVRTIRWMVPLILYKYFVMNYHNLTKFKLNQELTNNIVMQELDINVI